MVAPSEAVQSSKGYLAEIFPSSQGQDLRLEGIELSDDSLFWNVTFSYKDEETTSDWLERGRSYKTVKLRVADGEFVGARNGLL